jgi:hypothetical protein
VDDGRRPESLSYVADRDRSHSFLPGGEGRLTHILLCFQYRAKVWNIRPNQIIPLSPFEKQARREAGPNGSGQVKA